MFKFSRQNVTLKTLHTFIRYFRKSHYDVLKLRKNCSEKEIKEAFIKLSKEYHPDKNKDANAQQHFVRIVEAYNVLGKPSSRAQYDHSSEPLYSYPPQSNFHKAREYTKHSKPNSNYSYYNTQQTRRQQTYQQAQETYYGGLGVKKIPTYVLVMLCFGIAIVGTMLQVFVIREMYVVQKRQALERSQYLAEELEKVRQAAEGKTNEMQTRILLEKIVGSSNATIATASLGQALATADKENTEEPVLPKIDLSITELSNFWYSPQQMNEVKFNHLLKRLQMYFCYYYYGR